FYFSFFFFQAEDGIRDRTVTGVQTCALPISALLAMVLGLTAVASAEEFTGFIADQNCAGKPAMKNDAACAERCIKRGTAAVLWRSEERRVGKGGRGGGGGGGGREDECVGDVL